MTQKNRFGLFLLIGIFSLSMFTSCNFTVKTDEDGETTVSTNSEENSSDENDGEVNNLNDALKKVEEQFSNLQDKAGVKAEVVDFRTLKELLPRRAAGIKLTNSSGEKSGAMGFTISTAEGEYEKNDKTVTVKITDVAGAALLATGMAAWSVVDIDKENDEGFERTRDYEGQKVMEKYNTRYNEGTLMMLAHNRYIIEITGKEVDMDDMYDVLDDIDWEDLPKSPSKKDSEE